MTRAKYRGLFGVTIQTMLTTFVANVKKNGATSNKEEAVPALYDQELLLYFFI